MFSTVGMNRDATQRIAGEKSRSLPKASLEQPSLKQNVLTDIPFGYHYSLVKPLFRANTSPNSTSILSTNAFYKHLESELMRFGYPINTKYLVDSLKSVEKDLGAWHQKSDIPTVEDADKIYKSEPNGSNWYKTVPKDLPEDHPNIYQIFHRHDEALTEDGLETSRYREYTLVNQNIQVEREKLYYYNPSTKELLQREMRSNLGTTDQAPYKMEILSGIIDDLRKSKQTKVLHVIIENMQKKPLKPVETKASTAIQENPSKPTEATSSTDVSNEPKERLEVQFTYFNNPKVPYSLHVQYNQMNLHPKEDTWYPTGDNVTSYEYLRDGSVNIQQKTVGLRKKRRKQIFTVHEESKHLDPQGKYTFEVIKDYEIYPPPKNKSDEPTIVILNLKKRIGTEEKAITAEDLKVFHDTDGIAFLEAQMSHKT